MKKTVLLFVLLLFVNCIAKAQSITLATSTTNPTKGTVVYNNSTNQLQYWNGTTWVSLTNAAAGTGWALSGNNIHKANTGNVGIGTTTPAQLLTIRANNIGFSQESLDSSTAIGFYTGNGSAFIQTHTNHDLNFTTGNGGSKMTLQKGTGNLGIGTINPVNKLQIGIIGQFGYSGFDIGIGKGSQSAGISLSSSALKIASSNHILLRPGNGEGFVGINTDTPRGPLDVRAYTMNTGLAFAYFFRGENGKYVIGDTPSSWASVSIYADQCILAGQFISISDARVKNIVGISHSAQDLETLKNLQITDYTMRDSLQFGNKPFKKVIAQQIEEVYPQAVKKIRDVVPDIYSLTEKVVFDETNKTLTCTLAKSYDIQMGEKIEFIHPTAGKIKAEVIGVSGNTFTVKDWQYSTDKIFVYGREVNDFRSVDYEAISMLGISAIQQLAKENEELKAKNKETDRKFEQLSARLEALEAAHEAQLPKMSTGR